MKRFIIGLVALFLIGCGTTPKPPAFNIASDKIALPSLLGETETKTAACQSNGCTFKLTTIDEDTAEDFVTWIESATKNHVTLVNVAIDSNGGSVPSGYEIIKALESADKAGTKSACTVVGSSYSMAFATLQSCSYRYATGRATFMAHSIKVGIQGRMSQQDFEDGAAMLKADNYALAVQCSHRLKITLEEYLAKVTGKEWWLSSADAFEVGAIDRIVSL